MQSLRERLFSGPPVREILPDRAPRDQAELSKWCVTALGGAKPPPTHILSNQADAAKRAAEKIAAAGLSAAGGAAEAVGDAATRAAEAGQAAAAASADAAEAVAGRVADAVESSGCVDSLLHAYDVASDEAVDAATAAGAGAAGLYAKAGVAGANAREAIASSRAWTGAATAAGAVLDAAAPVLADATEGVADAAANAAEDVADAADAVDASCGAACAAAAGAVASSANFLGKLEIVRDFYQVLSLFVVHAHRALTGALDWLAVLAGTISFDFDFVFDIPSGVWYAIGVTLGVVAIFVVGWLLVETSAQLEHHREREGNEFKSWEDKDAENHRRLQIFRYTFVGLITVYLPVSQFSLEVLLCAIMPAGFAPRDCAALSSPLDWILPTLGALVFLSVTIAFPIQCYFLIEANKPVGSLEDADHRYNDDGDLVEYTDAMYARDLLEPEQKKNPYYFLYKDYERSHSAFKVHSQMMLKVALLLPIMLLAAWPKVQLSISLALACVFAVYSVRATPFLDAELDLVDLIARVATSVSIFGALVLAAFVYRSADEEDDDAAVEVRPGRHAAADAFDGIIQVTNITALVLFVLLMAYSSPRVKLFVKNCTGRITFSDSLTLGEGACHKIVPKWHLEAELRARAWYGFWHSTLEKLDAEGDGGQGDEETAEPKKRSGPTAATRLRELEHAAREKGLHRIERHTAEIAADPTVRADVHGAVCAELEGVDVFHESEEADRAAFGKLWVDPFPFTAAMVPDNGDATCFLFGNDQLRALLDANRAPDVVAQRALRADLRALSLSGALLALEHDEWRTYTVPDGTHTETTTDSDGNTTTRTVQDYSDVQVHLFFHRGVIGVAGETDTEMAAGFALTMTFHDGHGDAIKPRTREPLHIRDETTTLSADDLGLSPEPPCVRVPGTKLDALLADADNAKVAVQYLPQWREQERAYRGRLARERATSEAVLSSDFFLHVYHNHYATRDGVEQYLREFESAAALRALPETAAAALGGLFARLEFAAADGRCALWFCFWHDVWKCNGAMTRIAKAKALLDPDEPGALALTLLPPRELNRVLRSAGVRRGRTLVSDCVIATLYAELAAVGMKTVDVAAAVVASPLGEPGLEMAEKEGGGGVAEVEAEAAAEVEAEAEAEPEPEAEAEAEGGDLV